MAGFGVGSARAKNEEIGYQDLPGVTRGYQGLPAVTGKRGWVTEVLPRDATVFEWPRVQGEGPGATKEE